MDAKKRLKRIEKTLCLGTPSSIKDALASISGYLNTNPYHLGEYSMRISMLYRTLGVRDLFQSVKEQGELLADARKIEMENRLNSLVIVLTIITLIVGILTLVVNILCCNNCVDNLIIHQI